MSIRSTTYNDSNTSLNYFSRFDFGLRQPIRKDSTLDIKPKSIEQMAAESHLLELWIDLLGPDSLD